MSNNKIAPSILAADYANFASELKRIEEVRAGLTISLKEGIINEKQKADKENELKREEEK